MKKLLSGFLAALFALALPLQAQAQFTFLPYWYKTPSLEFNTSPGVCFDNSGDSTTYSNLAGAIDIEPATPTGALARRLVVMAIVGEDGTTNFSASGATMNGVAMTEVVDSANTGSFVQAAIYVGDPGPTATTVDFTWTWSEAITGSGACWYIITDLIDPSRAQATFAEFETSSGVIDLDVNVRAGGFVIGIAASGATGVTSTTVGFTESADDDVGADLARVVGFATTAADSIPMDLSFEFAGTSDSIGVAASFR